MSEAAFAWIVVALCLGVGAGWSMGRASAIRLCRRIARAGRDGALDRVFAEDALSDVPFRELTGPAEVARFERQSER